MKNTSAHGSAEAKGRDLAKAVSGDASDDKAAGTGSQRKVDGSANAKGRELAQAISGNTLEDAGDADSKGDEKS